MPAASALLSEVGYTSGRFVNVVVLAHVPWPVGPSPQRAANFLSGQFKTSHLWTPQVRPFPAPETGVDLYFTASCVRKLVWSLVRQLRGPHLSTCA